MDLRLRATERLALQPYCLFWCFQNILVDKQLIRSIVNILKNSIYKQDCKQQNSNTRTRPLSYGHSLDRFSEQYFLLSLGNKTT